MFWARPNVPSYLRRLRSRGLQLIWVSDFRFVVSCGLIVLQIDAICVNQMDTAEHNAEVLRMQSIYSGTRSVIIGIDSTATQEASFPLKIFSLFQDEPSWGSRSANLANLVRSESISLAVKILETTRNSHCGRTHDRVFGLIGPVLDALNFLPEPDYERDLTETSIAMCRAYIEKDHSTSCSWRLDFFLIRPSSFRQTHHSHADERKWEIKYKEILRAQRIADSSCSR